MMRTVVATRYVTALREGGSLPGLVEGDDDGLYVVKFRGAGQGPVRSSRNGWPARSAGRSGCLFRTSSRSRSIRLSATPSPTRRSTTCSARAAGSISGWTSCRARSPSTPPSRRGALIDPDFAADVVWLDSLVTNPDRTAQNPNLLVWHGRPWLIDHGAALYIHHTWRDPDEHARRPFELVREHVLLPYAGSIAARRRATAPHGRRCRSSASLVAAVPDLWLPADPVIGDAAAQRDAYVRYLARAARRRRARSSRRPSVPGAA